MHNTSPRVLAEYIHYYETLRPDTVSALGRLAIADLHFRDPFHDVQSRDAVVQILGRMFTMLPQPRFHVLDSVLFEEAAFLKWELVTGSGTGRFADLRIEGMSDIRFADNGLVRQHFDYWDAASTVYTRLPLLGRVLEIIKRRTAASSV